MTNPHGFIRRCGRPTLKGTACRQWITLAPACRKHMTVEEHADADAKQEAWDRFWAAGIREYPACWEWEPIETDDEATFIAWHDARCALCGGREHLVEDHDHETGMVRGWCCRSCNVREGVNKVFELFDRYRYRHPAAITGFAKRYVHPITGEPDYGAGVRAVDDWQNNATRGIGL